ncbi:acyl-CoA carboxylase subunit epsilon [Ammonicoccus fulvus]|uniref:Acyl-CoA carboxylase subunit epsilon n=1 Tax=Ammonicoccus fulvus TaxID=3138240 RepID=A0ABZ3FP51_9ACTN
MSNDQPVITVVSGSPTPEEMAAIITVLAAGSQSATEPPPRERKPTMGGWKSYVRTLRRSFHPGPGAWRHGDR